MSDEEKGFVIIMWLILIVSVVASIGLGIFYGKADESCLAMGYPKYRVTWNFRVFCTGYDGVLHPVVREAK